MLADLALPIILATVFTAGAYGIHKAERHADRVTVILGFAFITLAMLDVLALVGHITNDEPGFTSRAVAGPALLRIYPGG